ncbi:thioredoxin family protein [Roseateles sp. YR242]|uniref:thioredoxin family protein n=1 Tax=Roseateles sp. YR242 TaxID=1855305 RepID=UPI002100882F|nr:thioredoxin family protein [Roseateles sp. YR242]
MSVLPSASMSPAGPAADGQTPASTLLVACLCAAWCRVCDTYRDDFAQLRQQYPGARFIWVDIEDDAELVDDLEVETFPTLLIGQQERLCFIGPVLPQPGAAQRLVQAAVENPAMTAASASAPAGTTAAAQALLCRLRQAC